MAFNKVILEGRITADPELKKTGSDIEYCNFSVAVDRDFKKGEEKEADFINIKAWRHSAKFVCDYFHKGDGILIEGRLQVDKRTGDDGTTRTYTSVVADRCVFTIPKKRTDAPATAAPSEGFVEIESDGDDDDLPF